MACGITSSAPANPANASRRISTERHHEKSGSASRNKLIAPPKTPERSRAPFPGVLEKAMVKPLCQFLQTPVARVERTVLEVEKRGDIERLLVNEAALFALRHIGPDESGESLDIVEPGAGVLGVQPPHRRDRAAAFSVGAVADGALALVHHLAARR